MTYYIPPTGYTPAQQQQYIQQQQGLDQQYGMLRGLGLNQATSPYGQMTYGGWGGNTGGLGGYMQPSYGWGSTPQYGGFGLNSGSYFGQPSGNTTQNFFRNLMGQPAPQQQQTTQPNMYTYGYGPERMVYEESQQAAQTSPPQQQGMQDTYNIGGTALTPDQYMALPTFNRYVQAYQTQGDQYLNRIAPGS